MDGVTVTLDNIGMTVEAALQCAKESVESPGAEYPKLLKAARAKGHQIHHDGCANIRHT